MATHRADVDMSAQYKPMEDVFIQIGKGQKDDPVYKMNSAEKDCLDTFMMARNNDLVWGKTDVDENGIILMPLKIEIFFETVFKFGEIWNDNTEHLNKCVTTIRNGVNKFYWNKN